MTAHELLFDGEAAAPRTLVLAHGAGAAMDTPFMSDLAGRLAGPRLRVARFEFPYMRRRREDGKRRGPDRQPVLLDTWRQVVEQLGDPARLVIGGKSMGGRMASYVADELAVAGLVCLGYPFHPPGRPEKQRVEHLASLTTPTLVVQGERDPFGNPEDVASYRLASTIEVEWLSDGDHSFRPRRKSGATLEQNLEQAALAVLAFLEGLG